MEWLKLILIAAIAVSFLIKFSEQQTWANGLWAVAGIAALGFLISEIAEQQKAKRRDD